MQYLTRAIEVINFLSWIGLIWCGVVSLLLKGIAVWYYKTPEGKLDLLCKGEYINSYNLHANLIGVLVFGSLIYITKGGIT